MKRWASAILLALLLVFAGARMLTSVEPLRDAWWMVGTTSSLGAIIARLSTSDAGLLKEQVTTRLLLMEPGAEPMEHRAVGLRLPEVATLATPTDQLSSDDDGWTLRISGGETEIGRAHV